ncbi:MAG: hypothetical protein ABSA51_03055, partial [Anaerolineaceae bacterium]
SSSLPAWPDHPVITLQTCSAQIHELNSVCFRRSFWTRRKINTIPWFRRRASLARCLRTCILSVFDTSKPAILLIGIGRHWALAFDQLQLHNGSAISSPISHQQFLQPLLIDVEVHGSSACLHGPVACASSIPPPLLSKLNPSPTG